MHGNHESGCCASTRIRTGGSAHPSRRCVIRNVVVVGLQALALAVSQGVADIIPVLNLHTSQAQYNNQSFTGTGYVGLAYMAAMNFQLVNTGLGWGELDSPSARTVLQVDISGLSGTIPGAYLSFDLKDGHEDAQDITVTSFTSTGTILGGAWTDFWNPPDTLGSGVYSIQGKAPNSIDVTDMLQARIDANADWFGLHIQGQSTSVEHWTFAPAADTDRAEVRLTIIPEPSTLALLLIGAGGALALLRTRVHTTRARST